MSKDEKNELQWKDFELLWIIIIFCFVYYVMYFNKNISFVLQISYIN